ADLCQLGVPGIDWDWALCHMDTDLRRTYGEDYLLRGLAEPITHTLDLAFGYQCTAKVARYVGANQLARQFEGLATQWVNTVNRADGLIVDSTYYEGGKGNYSCRLLHDMQTRIGLAGVKAGSSRCWTSTSATAPTRSSSSESCRAQPKSQQEMR